MRGSYSMCSARRGGAPRLPALPKLLDRKLYKAGQTRGADDDEIYQNRVLRNNTVLIRYDLWEQCRPTDHLNYEKGYIVEIPPNIYFGMENPTAELAARNLRIGQNALVFYETRQEWINHNPETLGWRTATSRENPLGGEFVARISANTAQNGQKINRGFTTTKDKGAGIRVYEYASTESIGAVRLQLETLFWLCHDADEVVIKNGMHRENAKLRKVQQMETATTHALLDFPKFAELRIVDRDNNTVCPLCLEKLSADGFFERLKQVKGREVLDQTVTALNLFHLEELRPGRLSHRVNNVGWGHHHCNIVVKDLGIQQTLEWMRTVVAKNATL
jgi:hypothetical protein